MIKFLQGDCIEQTKTLPDESVHCVITSPPYWGLRDYGTAKWEGGDTNCDHKQAKEKSRYDYSLATSPIQDGERKGTDAPKWKDVCPSCGAKKIDNQLGLEKTPEEYVAKMVEVFREVRRVLRKDGTCWLNLGDSYAGSWGATSHDLDGKAKRTGSNNRPPQSFVKSKRIDRGSGRWGGGNLPPTGILKPKDLCGIPWRVALALQQPYYTGKIKNKDDRIWLAAIIDGEGCMFIHKRKAGQSNGQGYERKNDSYGAGLEVANCHESIVKRCLEITGAGSICFQDKESRFKNRNQRLFRWNLRSNECREIVREIYPHFIGKKHEARLLLGCPSSGKDAELAHQGLINLHNGLDAGIDFPEPGSMYEPGFYLRQDVIWSKNNPMPESVTDRCTKSHEYIFLLTKSAQYYYDADATKEPAADSTINDTRLNRPGYDVIRPERGFPGQPSRGAGLLIPKSYKGSLPGRKDGQGQSRRGKGDRIHGNLPGRDDGGVACNNPDQLRRNKRSVWTVNTQPCKDAHFATFPPDLIRPCIRAGTSERGCCPKCGGAWKRILSESTGGTIGRSWHDHKNDLKQGQRAENSAKGGSGYEQGKTVGWQPSCKCNIHEPISCTVLDPFGGAGTTGLVAEDEGRNSIMIELNPDYIAIAKRRTQQQGLFCK